MNYIPNTLQETKEMMDLLGVRSIEELFEDIDESLRIKGLLELPEPLAEMEIFGHMRELGDLNAHTLSHACFLGGGAYDHFIPSAVEHLISRAEFYTSYTPYQAEMSQGLLQSIFEFQTMICELTDMDVANASMYDGASALAEAAIMAVKNTERKRVTISKTVHPEYREVLRTYANAYGIEVFEVDIENGSTDMGDAEKKVNDESACVIVQSPNFFGCLENLGEISRIAEQNDCIFVASVVEPISLGILKPPGSLGADIVVGEAQAFGNPISYGGPHIGFLATKGEYLKKLPGRISGITVDTEGERGFILTLQAREQHIRRERATSNICTNQALNALAATIYLALVGKTGLKKIAEICAHRAHYACKRITEIPGFEICFDAPFFNEFAVSCPSPPIDINKALLQKKIIGGLDLGRFYKDLENSMLFCFTEMNPRKEIEGLIGALEGVIP